MIVVVYGILERGGNVHGQRKAKRSSQPFPTWAPKAGVVFAAGTLVFFMVLVLLSVFEKNIPDDAKFPIVAVLALGLASASAFLGGDAAAKGQLPVSFLNARPVQFSVAGGIAVFVIVFLFGIGLYPSTGAAGARRPLDLTGDWHLTDDSKDYYRAKLTQTGKKVSGEYTRNDEKGFIEGSLQDKQLNLTWDQLYNQRGGTAELTISPTGTELIGRWSYDPQKYNSGLRGGNTWRFIRIAQE
jgi:hypothetical protein